MAEVQLALDYEVKSPAPRVTPAEIEWLVGFLDGKAWMSAAAIEALSGVNDRKVRAIARAARPRVVSYPGSPGYRLWKDCTPEDIQHCLSAFASQRDDMAESYFIYFRAHHGGFRG